MRDALILPSITALAVLLSVTTVSIQAEAGSTAKAVWDRHLKAELAGDIDALKAHPDPDDRGLSG